MTDAGVLTAATASQAAVLDRISDVLGPVDVVAEHSQSHRLATVLELATPGDERVIAKWHAPGPDYARETTAYEQHVSSLGGDAPRLIDSDDALRLLVLTKLPGHVVQGTAASGDPDVHRTAGLLLRRFHESGRCIASDLWATQFTTRFDRWVERAADKALVAADDLDAVARIVAEVHELGPLEVVPAHRDYSTRNWMVDDHGRVRVIDFGKLEYDPWVLDLVRLQQREWLDAPLLEAAFLDGYDRGLDGADRVVLRAATAKHAVSTIVWARDHRDRRFEREARETLERVLGRTLY